MGGCDLVLLQNPSFGGGLGLDVHGRTRMRYQYSYVESAALRIGEDTLEVSSFGGYSINGIESPFVEGHLVGNLAGFPIFHTQVDSKKHIFEVVLSPGQNVTLATMKDLVSVHIDEQGSFSFDGTTGLMGDYDSGAMLGRDGTMEFTDPIAFGQEWQVLDTEAMLFRTAIEPQYPQKCLLPDTAILESRRLGENGVTQEEAKAACSHLTGIDKDNCVYDVVATGDLDMALTPYTGNY